ncbi:hypothetical protein ACA910_010534 [Epithemia clementina (nom. ined.)]
MVNALKPSCFWRLGSHTELQLCGMKRSPQQGLRQGPQTLLIPSPFSTTLRFFSRHLADEEDRRQYGNIKKQSSLVQTDYRSRKDTSSLRKFASSPDHSGKGDGNNDDNDEDNDKSMKFYFLQGKTHPSSISGVVVDTINTGHSMATDLPRPMGGQNLAPQPVELLLASWMGCTQATAVFVARQMRRCDGDKDDQKNWRHVSLQGLEFVDIQAQRDERGALQLPLSDPLSIPSRLQQINGIIRVHLQYNGRNNDSKTKFRRNNASVAEQTTASNQGEPSSDFYSSYIDFLRHQTEQRCPVANMIIASGCQMNLEWVAAEDLSANDGSRGRKI